MFPHGNMRCLCFCPVGKGALEMGFTTQIFLFVYFPLAVGGTALCRWLERHFPPLRRVRLEDWALAAGSLLFYGWAVFDGIGFLLLYALAVWGCGRLLQASARDRLVLPLFQEEGGAVRPFRWYPVSRLVFWAGVGAALLLLFLFKYWAFAGSVWRSLTGRGLREFSLAAPVGVSFITFSAVSYLADIRRGMAPAGSFLDCLLYLSFFPKVISGPIVLWRDFGPQLAAERRVGLEDISAGLERIMIGFAKKLILADLLVINGMVDAVSAWWAALLYMLRLYYDFSGYSDIALGLGRLLGFRFRENFDFPYRSCSITEFWRRWHISLGAWFREYVYIPIGGSRRGTGRALWNLAVVFALTGVWHGAGWNYILWGGINAFFVILERLVWEKPWYRKLPRAVKWAGTMLVVMLFWQLFRFQRLAPAVYWTKVMFGLPRAPDPTFTWEVFFPSREVFLAVVGVLGATVLGGPRAQAALRRLRETRVGFALWNAVLLVLFVLSVLCMVNSVYKPFIYFQY